MPRRKSRDKAFRSISIKYLRLPAKFIPTNSLLIVFDNGSDNIHRKFKVRHTSKTKNQQQKMLLWSNLCSLPSCKKDRKPNNTNGEQRQNSNAKLLGKKRKEKESVSSFNISFYQIALSIYYILLRVF